MRQINGQRQFVWVGFNKHFKKYWVSDVMTTDDILNDNYLSFFSKNNRRSYGNCDFKMELYEGDSLMFHSKNSLSNFGIIFKDGKAYGEGPFNTHELEVYFNSDDMLSIEIENQNLLTP